MKRNKFATYENGKNIKGFWVKPEFVHLSGRVVNDVFPEFSGRNITNVVVSDAVAEAVCGPCMKVWICTNGRWDYRWMEWRAKELFDRLHPLWGEEEDWDDDYSSSSHSFGCLFFLFMHHILCI